MILPVDPARYAAYLAAMAAMAAFPGPANLFSMATGIAHGRRAALAVVAGMNTATVIWYGAAALGLGALATALPLAVTALKVAGALYLLWLAWGAFSSRKGGSLASAAARPGHAFRDGFAVQIANPKLMLLFTAVLPPFLDLSRPLIPQLVLFALATLTLDLAAMSAFGLFGAALAGRMASPGFRRGFSYVSAGLLVAAAILVALSS
jgi:threonine/homoserine/homoserine lactone efflux protein